MCWGGSSKKEKSKQNSLQKKQNNKKKLCTKIVLLGNVAVGKTSITQRYVHGKFDENYFNTLGGAYVEKNITTNQGNPWQLNIWDTAGDERYRSIMPLYYRDASAAVLVYDVTDFKSLEDLEYWIKELDEKVKKDSMVLCLLGNKNDVSKEQKRVQTEQAQEFANSKNLIFGECSAKTGDGIEEVFSKLTQELEARGVTEK
ncbi:P-loop containing nucleoside triphosphate hydrolase [Pseudocohnilembus persalinus]|uniref:p-loop containing nucleoside triphosphate hydrolase n=1 Tax=Pseudocohnilembus persalinus TaxID=266149 RepID=A0A0V0QPF9_PSEPJ|nr:P-loop containing nucleoside triphosphate hydrolase [Pseudocohnilembus persalinus]|eukprot:KRX04036.1 P-loop containing nucleoside triphosphate hydrolase [Pseudocohnilembus persalinus]